MLHSLVHRFIVWYLGKAGGAFHVGSYGRDGRYVTAVSDDQYRLLQNLANQPPPWQKPGYRYGWNDPVWVPASLREEAKSAPWVRR
jgi:hypothetical protein